MRKATLSLIAVFAVAFSVSAFAQAERDVKTGGAGREETLKVAINGGWDVVWAHFERDAADIITFGGQAFPQSFMTGRFHLDLHASLQDSVDIHVRIQSLNNNGIPFRGNVPTPNLDGSQGGQIAPLGMTDLFSLLELDELYASIREVIDPAITLTVGLQTYVWDPTGSGTPLLLALGRSEPLWPKVRNDNAPIAATRGEAGFAGVRVDYARDKFALTVGLLQTNTVGTVGINGKERVFFVNASFDVTEDGSRVGVIGALFSGDGTGGGSGKKDQIVTLGGGARIRAASDINAFGEVYVQSGSTNDVFDIDAAGMMFRAGVHIAFPGSTPAWVELSYISVSGDDPSDSGEDANFYSYENDDDMVMFGSSEWGIDLDDNYVMIKVKAGVSLSTGGGTNNLNLIGRVALVRPHEDAAPLPDDNWGMETNATVEYVFNKNVKVYVTVAHMSGGDIQESLTSGSADSGLMFLVGTAGNF